MLRSSYGKPGHSLVWPRIRNVQQISMRSKLGPCRHKKEPEPSMHSGLLSLLPQLKFFWLGGECRGDRALRSRSFFGTESLSAE